MPDAKLDDNFLEIYYEFINDWSFHLMFTRVFWLQLFTGRLGLVWLDFNSEAVTLGMEPEVWEMPSVVKGGEDGSRGDEGLSWSPSTCQIGPVDMNVKCLEGGGVGGGDDGGQ